MLLLVKLPTDAGAARMRVQEHAKRLSSMLDETLNGRGVTSFVICYAGGADCRYIVFKKEQQWRVVGLIESLDNQYRPPEHRLVTSKEGCWFAITQLSGRGTGFLSYSELWYDLSKSTLPVVLDYPVSGNSVQGDRSRDYEFTSTVSLNRRHPLSIRVRYQVREFPQKYGRSSIDWHAHKEYQIWYEWDRQKGRFRLRPSRSVLPVESDPVFFLAEKARRRTG